MHEASFLHHAWLASTWALFVSVGGGGGGGGVGSGILIRIVWIGWFMLSSHVPQEIACSVATVAWRI